MCAKTNTAKNEIKGRTIDFNIKVSQKVTV